MLVPPAPGVFSALGLLFSDSEHEVVRTLMLRGVDGARSSARRGVRRARGRSRFVLRRQQRHGSDGDEASPTSATRARPTSSPCRCRRGPSTSTASSRTSWPSTSGRTATAAADDPVDVVSIRAVAARRAHCLEALRPGCGDPLARAAREHAGGVLRPRARPGRDAGLQPRRPAGRRASRAAARRRDRLDLRRPSRLRRATRRPTATSRWTRADELRRFRRCHATASTRSPSRW